MKDPRLLFHVHGRKFCLAPPRRPGGAYYIRFEGPSNSGKHVATLARLLISLGTREAIQARVGAALRLSERHIEPSKWAGSLCAAKEQRSG
jgi:hypothetical protein